MTRWLLAGLLFITAGQALGQSEAQCERAAVHYEASNQGILTQRAVIESIRARVKKSGKSTCQVLLEPSQYPWATRKRLKIKLDGKQRVTYDMARRMSSNVLPNSSYRYFNKRPHPWSCQRKKVGDLTFNNVKEKKHGC